MLAVDFAVLVVLVSCRGTCQEVGRSVRWNAMVHAGVVGLLLIAFRVSPNLLVSSPGEPDRLWIGQTLPLLNDIDIRDRIEHGRWRIALVHHDCPKCLEIIGRLEAEIDGAFRTAIVELPPHGLRRDDANSTVVYGRLEDTDSYEIVTPLVLIIENGTVVSMLTDDESG